MGNLVNLRVLQDGYGSCSTICSRIPNVGNLAFLQGLETYNVGKSREYGIEQLGGNLQLEGSLQINDLENVEDKGAAKKAKINEKRRLERLTLRWGRGRAGGSGIMEDEEVIEGLEPHQNVQYLKIYGYQGTKLPSWMLINLQDCSPNLCTLELMFCNNLTSLPLNLPHGLETLKMLECPNLTSLPPNLPHGLKTLEISNCSNLTGLPPNLPHSLKTLEMWSHYPTFLFSPEAGNNQGGVTAQPFLFSPAAENI